MSELGGPVWNAKSGHVSDLDWGLRVSRTPPKVEEEEKERCSCSCGNSKARSHLIERFSQTSSLHGVHYVCSRKNRSCLLKFIYRVLYCICFLLVIINVLVLCTEAFGKESTFINSNNKDMELGKVEDPDFFPDYPRITLCRKPFYKSGLNMSYFKLFEYSILALGYPFLPFTPEEVSMLVQISLTEDRQGLPPKEAKFQSYLREMDDTFQQLQNSSENFDLKSFILNNSVSCEDFFSFCIALVFPLDCCQIFKPVLTTMGLCYTLEEPKDILELIQNSPIEFAFIVDLFSPPHLDRSTEEGFNIFLTDPQEKDFLFRPSEGQKIVPGLVTTVTAQLVKSDRSALHTPWHGISNCPHWPPELDESPDRYYHRRCESFSFFSVLRQSCECESIIYSGAPTTKFCEPKDLYQCFLSITIGKNFTTVPDLCQKPCIIYQYKSAASYIGLGKQNLSRLEILYNSKQFAYQEYRTSTLSNLFSQIGGLLGLYLGASIITVVEIVTFVASWIWYRICPCRTAKVRQDTTSLHRQKKDGSEHF